GCLGALDGTYIPVRVPSHMHGRYRNRKTSICVNVLGVCNREMNFSYVLTGWEGSAADSRVLRDAVHRNGGLRVPIDDFGDGNRAPTNYRELFNLRHARARNVIERSFGVLKMRWAVLRSKTFFSIATQNKIILACCLLQNYIRASMNVDPMEFDGESFVSQSENHSGEDPPEYVDVVDPTPEFSNWRDTLAISIVDSSSLMVSSATGGRNSKSNGNRRVWTMEEERALINGLKELVSRGWKCDNGFRNGYTALLEKHMSDVFPNTDLKAEPHISSKISVWKKNYGLIAGMMATSGFGWSDTGNMVTVREEDVWIEYLK
ncbi:Unknown protein, partial [Striga hermonthica]